MRLLIYILLLVPILFHQSCRKGEDDPFLSFKSRNNRLIADWNLVSLIGSTSYVAADGEEIQQNFYYNENVSDKMTEYIIHLTDGVRYDYYYDYFDIYMSVYEDRTIDCSYKGEGYGFYNWTKSGEWSWSSKGKRKEYVDLEALEFVYEGKTSYRIKRLAEHELILVLEINDKVIDETGKEYEVEGTHTFTFRNIE